MYKLEEEQIDYIIEEYGGNRQLINYIERKLNLLGIVEDEEDYYELIISIVAQKETNKLELSRCITKIDRISKFINIDTIIMDELKRKYNNFEDSRPFTKRKMGL